MLLQVFCVFLFISGACVFGTIISNTNTVLTEIGREASQLAERMEGYQILISSCRWYTGQNRTIQRHDCVLWSKHNFKVSVISICCVAFYRADMKLCMRIREWLRFQLTQERLEQKVHHNYVVKLFGESISRTLESSADKEIDIRRHKINLPWSV